MTLPQLGHIPAFDSFDKRSDSECANARAVRPEDSED
jgi:hypothetical protein